MISSFVSRASAVVLAAAALPLLFASDVILSVLVPGLPPSSAWLGQLIAAGWLSIALFNWSARTSVLGGIYGRPIVNLNLVLYMVSALGLLKAERAPVTLRVLSIPFMIMAIVYGALLLRGPFERSTAS